MNAFAQWGYIAAGAVAGAWLRHAVNLALNPRWAGFPLGTLAANLSGACAAGALWMALQGMPSQHPARLLLTTGLLGAFTTFSAFSVESLQLLQRGEYTLFAWHGLLHVGGGLLAAALGAWGWRTAFG